MSEKQTVPSPSRIGTMMADVWGTPVDPDTSSLITSRKPLYKEPTLMSDGFTDLGPDPDHEPIRTRMGDVWTNKRVVIPEKKIPTSIRRRIWVVIDCVDEYEFSVQEDYLRKGADVQCDVCGKGITNDIIHHVRGTDYDFCTRCFAVSDSTKTKNAVRMINRQVYTQTDLVKPARTSEISGSFK